MRALEQSRFWGKLGAMFGKSGAAFVHLGGFELVGAPGATRHRASHAPIRARGLRALGHALRALRAAALLHPKERGQD
jgi:hypothetical protein